MNGRRRPTQDARSDQQVVTMQQVDTRNCTHGMHRVDEYGAASTTAASEQSLIDRSEMRLNLQSLESEYRGSLSATTSKLYRKSVCGAP